MGFIACVSLIFAGAIGNIIDSAFYGLIFNDSDGQVSTLFPAGGGYATFLHGRVVDMFYFPLFSGSLSRIGFRLPEEVISSSFVRFLTLPIQLFQ